jgi:hypothetical protein
MNPDNVLDRDLKPSNVLDLERDQATLFRDPLRDPAPGDVVVAGTGVCGLPWRVVAVEAGRVRWELPGSRGLGGQMTVARWRAWAARARAQVLHEASGGAA